MDNVDKVDQIFKQLDDWRNLPTYQLERRADIFFSVYLKEILKVHTGTDIHEIVIPEFPLHINTLYPDRPMLDPRTKKEKNLSNRADYFARSTDGQAVYLVELKTDVGSGRDKQDKYLKRAKKSGLPALLSGLLKIVEASKARRKYLCLLKKLEALGMMNDLNALEECLGKDRYIGFHAARKKVMASTENADIFLVCIQPKPCSDKDKDRPYDYWVSFEDVRRVVIQYEDAFSRRFAESLKGWETQAGDCFN